MKRLVAFVVVVLGLATTTGTADAHVHGITPLLTLANECGVTTLSNTGANRAQGDPITGLIPRDVGSAPLTVEDGGFFAPVGCA
jgi:urease alpha subunit